MLKPLLLFIVACFLLLAVFTDVRDQASKPAIEPLHNDPHAGVLTDYLLMELLGYSETQAISNDSIALNLS